MKLNDLITRQASADSILKMLTKPSTSKRSDMPETAEPQSYQSEIETRLATNKTRGGEIQTRLDANSAEREAAVEEIRRILNKPTAPLPDFDPSKAVNDTERGVLAGLALLLPSLGIRNGADVVKAYRAPKEAKLEREYKRQVNEQTMEAERDSRLVKGGEFQIEQIDKTRSPLEVAASKNEAEGNDLAIAKDRFEMDQRKLSARTRADDMRYNPSTRKKLLVDAGYSADEAHEMVGSGDKLRIMQTKNLVDIIKSRPIDRQVKIMAIELNAKLQDERLKQSASQFAQNLQLNFARLQEQRAGRITSAALRQIGQTMREQSAVGEELRKIDADIAMYQGMMAGTADPKSKADLQLLIKGLGAKRDKTKDALNQMIEAAANQAQGWQQQIDQLNYGLDLQDPEFDTMGGDSDPLPRGYEPRPFDSAPGGEGARAGAIAGGGSGDEVINAALKVAGFADKQKCPPGVDCSKFTQSFYHQLGIKVPRTTSEQVKQGKKIGSYADMKPGDAIFFHTIPGDKDQIGHTGIYLGNGQFAHASGGAKKGYTYKIANLKDWNEKVRAIRRFT